MSVEAQGGSASSEPPSETDEPVTTIYAARWRMMATNLCAPYSHSIVSSPHKRLIQQSVSQHKYQNTDTYTVRELGC